MCAEFSSERSCSRSQDVVELTATGCEETSRWLDRYGTTSLLLLTLEADNELFTHWTNVTVLGRDNVLWDSLRCQKCGQVGLNVADNKIQIEGPTYLCVVIWSHYANFWQ